MVGAAADGQPMTYSDTLHLEMDRDPFPGIFMCSHDSSMSEKAVCRLDGGRPEEIETGFAVSLNNDHGLPSQYAAC